MDAYAPHLHMKYESNVKKQQLKLCAGATWKGTWNSCVHRKNVCSISRQLPQRRRSNEMSWKSHNQNISIVWRIQYNMHTRKCAYTQTRLHSLAHFTQLLHWKQIGIFVSLAFRPFCIYCSAHLFAFVTQQYALYYSKWIGCVCVRLHCELCPLPCPFEVQRKVSATEHILFVQVYKIHSILMDY